MKLLSLIAFAILIVGCGVKERKEREKMGEMLDQMGYIASGIEKSCCAKKDSLQALLDTTRDTLRTIREEEQMRSIDLEFSNQQEENAVFAKYEGKHLMSLQWIEGESFGSCEWTLASEGEFDVHGEHKNEQGDYCTINGTMLLMGDYLEFNGKIESKVSYINDGKPCIRDGRYTFKSTGNRKYWRLQEMDNCEGNNVVDYVDIYFK